MEEEIFPIRKAAEAGEQQEKMPGKVIPIKLSFTEAAGFQVLDFCGGRYCTSGRRGFEVKAAFAPGRWLTGFILSFGADARVLEPEWLKEQIKNEAEKIKKLYHI